MTAKEAASAVGKLRKQIAEELPEEEAMRLLQLVDEAAHENRVWSARGLKDNMAQVLNGAVEGRPQMIKRPSDEEAMLLVSMKDLMEVFKPVKPLTFLQSIQRSFPDNLVVLPAARTAPIDKRSLPKLAQEAEVYQPLHSASA